MKLVISWILLVIVISQISLGSFVEKELIDANNPDVPYYLFLIISGSYFCGGVIISDKWAVTSANCLYAVSSPSQIVIKRGTTPGAATFSVTEFYIHPQFNAETINNDVGVLRISGSLIDETGGKIIPLVKLEPNDGVEGFITGWCDARKSIYSTPMSVISRERCKCNHIYFGFIQASMICGGVSLADSCQGKTGDPIIVGNNLAGILSWGLSTIFECPSIITSIAAPSIRSFISSTTGV